MSKFSGFPIPRENWSKLPHVFIEALPIVRNVGELKCILYILRHTWGYQDTGKRITVDEFMHGRKKRDGTRIDDGTGLAKTTILAGLKQAEAHGFIVVVIDDRDKGRVKKSYSLKMQLHTPGVQNSYPWGKEPVPRTEKETLERNDDDDGLATAGLIYLGVSPDVAKTEVGRCGPDLVVAWCASLHRVEADNLPGLILSKLRHGSSATVWPMVFQESIDGFLEKVRKAVPGMSTRLGTCPQG